MISAIIYAIDRHHLLKVGGAKLLMVHRRRWRNQPKVFIYIPRESGRALENGVALVKPFHVLANGLLSGQIERGSAYVLGKIRPRTRLRWRQLWMFGRRFDVKKFASNNTIGVPSHQH